jgi:hypothetical protein
MTDALSDSFLAILTHDVGVALQRNEEADNQATRRDTIRSAFAAIEGLVWIFREEIVDAAQATYGLEQDEMTILQERQLSVTEQGKISAQARYLTLTTTIRFLARIASRITGTEPFDFGAGDWDEFRKAIAIRNRITHPKSADDLLFSKEDVDRVKDALFWFLHKHAEVLAQTVETRKAYLGQLDQLFEKLKAGDPEMVELYNAIRDRDA